VVCLLLDIPETLAKEAAKKRGVTLLEVPGVPDRRVAAVSSLHFKECVSVDLWQLQQDAKAAASSSATGEPEQVEALAAV